MKLYFLILLFNIIVLGHNLIYHAKQDIASEIVTQFRKYKVRINELSWLIFMDTDFQLSTMWISNFIDCRIQQREYTFWMPQYFDDVDKTFDVLALSYIQYRFRDKEYDVIYQTFNHTKDIYVKVKSLKYEF